MRKSLQIDLRRKGLHNAPLVRSGNLGALRYPPIARSPAEVTQSPSVQLTQDQAIGF